MATRRGDLLSVPAAALLLWPALWNGYPIVFADTGTYLSQAVHRYAGWDRPVFYSLFMLPLHATVTVWPVVAVQALLAARVLRCACRVVAPGLSAGAFVAMTAGLAAFTCLPWLVSELMPDLFTPLTVLALFVLGSEGTRRRALAALTAFMIATQQSSVPLAAILAAGGLSRPVMSALVAAIHVLRPLRSPKPWMAWPSPAMTVGVRWPRTWFALLPPVLAILALCSANLAAHGRFAVSPFGNIFLLARVIYDGPGRTALRQDCPAAGWRLCPYRERLPPTSDDFLWMPDSPLNRAGGPKAVSTEADAIIAAALRADPAGAVRTAVANTIEQLGRFDSGDGLNPWPAQVAPWIRRDFPPAEAARYAAARQQNGALQLPEWLARTHQAVSLAGVAACLSLLPLALRRRPAAACLLATVLLALPLNAAITGVLSGPHDRYQARVMWLPPFAAALAAIALRRA